MAQKQNYILIGAGGTGSHFIPPVLPYLERHHRDEGTDWQFVIIDGDNYDTGNLERQLFDPALTTVNKAEAMVQMYSRFPVRAVPRFIGRDDLQTIIQNGDIVFLGVDNYSVRALVQERALELDDIVVVNAGNEEADGSVQLWVRQGGENKTPRLSYGHPEIKYIDADDRAFMSCQQAAELPGGGQLIIANQAAAHHMMAALYRYHRGLWTEGWTELQFDLNAGTVVGINMRERRNWAR